MAEDRSRKRFCKIITSLIADSYSLTVAYGIQSDDWSYIPGGVGSGTALIRPDFPELLEWPYLWQQTEYVLGGGSSNFMFMVLAADKLLNK